MRTWRPVVKNENSEILAELLGDDYAENIDVFTQNQLATVISICRKSKSLADAGHKLFSVSRQQRAKTNDTDRLRKYLQKFGLTWQQLKGE